MSDKYHGNSFSIDHVGGDWTIWRFSDDDGNREQIILTDEAMDELRDYFAAYYDEDRSTN
jgi:hypothetical protein